MSTDQLRKFVDEIRAYVNSPDQTDDPRVAEFARQYAQACRDANQRLQRCGDLLEKGHRPEAIAIAEAEPDLLEVVSILTFPELDEWQEVSAGYGWERFQPLKMEIASSINDAYASVGQAADLLNKHRRLALAQAPVKERLAVMRRIAEMDTTSPFWGEDISLFEKHRAKELQELGGAAANSRNGSQQEQFFAEYEAERWLSSPPRDLHDGYCAMFVNYHESHTLTKMANRISFAMVNLDTDQLHQWHVRWAALVAKIHELNGRWQVPQQLQAVVGPAFAYLQQHEEKTRYAAFLRDIQVLVQAIRQDVSADQIQLCLERAESHGFPLPPQAAAELADYRAGTTQTKVLNVVLIVVLVLAGLTALIIAFFMFRGSPSEPTRASQVEKAVREHIHLASSRYEEEILWPQILGPPRRCGT